MKTVIPSGFKRVIILDVSGVYAQIHNQGFFPEESLSEIEQQYSDKNHWKIVVLEIT